MKPIALWILWGAFGGGPEPIAVFYDYSSANGSARAHAICEEVRGAHPDHNGVQTWCAPVRRDK